MITVLQAAGLSFAIYQHDHPPPHVHVYGDGVAKIAIVGRTGRSEVIYAKGMKDGDVRKALRVVDEHQTVLIQYWSELHG
jgi:hypothetical protein